MSEIELYLFDVDGTVLYTWPFICASHGFVMKELGISNDALKHPEMRHCVLERAYELCQIPRDKYHLASSLHKKFQLDPENLKIIERFEHTERVLKALCENGKHTGVVSNRQGNTQRILEFTGISKYFECVIAREDVMNPKPDPEGIRKARNLFGIPAEKTVYIGDTEVDVIAGKADGCVTVAVDGSDCHAALVAQQPDYLISDIGEVLALPFCRLYEKCFAM